MQEFDGWAMLGDKFLRFLFRRCFRHRLNAMLAPEHAVVLDYPVKVFPRYGYGKPSHPQLRTILEAGRAEYAKRLNDFCKLKDSLQAIPQSATADVLEPCWGPQRFFSSLDAVALYGMLVEFRPGKIIEVGSGYSTRFARRAICDHALPTKITSIDPQPRAEIDAICDAVVRQPLEEVDLRIFDSLEPGDFLFIDSSHRAFTNSDVTIVFMDLLPRLRQGVIVHIHDIFWPYDYPANWNARYYSEQDLLGAFLLGAGTQGARILLPNAFIVHDRDLAGNCEPLLAIAGVRRDYDEVFSPYQIAGGSFWFQN